MSNEIAIAQQVRRIKETHYYPKSAWLMHLILMEALLPIHAFGVMPLALALKKTS